MRWAGCVARTGDRRGAYRVLVKRHEGKKLHGRHRRRWEDDIELDLREVLWGDMDWTDPAQDRTDGGHL